MQTEVDRFKTELLGELQKNREEIDKARLANEGFKAELAQAVQQMKVVGDGVIASGRAQADKMEKTYQGLAKQFDEVKAQVAGYKTQLRNVSVGLEGILKELNQQAP
ncbi:MAG: hypothetical protein HY721_12775 [Planctomycetes bacterium]|nr:hypothetical protein [Planctomycetota bacterium]